MFKIENNMRPSLSVFVSREIVLNLKQKDPKTGL